jgi:hypothetical protein
MGHDELILIASAVMIMIGLIMMIPMRDHIISHHLLINEARHSICEEVYLRAWIHHILLGV